MEYVPIENDFRLALGAQPEDFAQALLRAYQNAIRIAVTELPVIKW
jgi:hypothetical protein